MNIQMLQERAFAITGRFEGMGGYANVAGNFDGMGVSFGMFQQNFGTGGLQAMLLKMHEAGTATFQRCCTVAVKTAPHNGAKVDLSSELLRVCRLPSYEAVHWADERMDQDDKRRFASNYTHWVEVFKRLGAEPGFQAIQREKAQVFWNDAIMDAKFFDIRTERGVAGCFDVSIQNGCGKIGKVAQDEPMRIFRQKGGMNLPYQDRLIALAESIAITARKEYRYDVLSRKLAIWCGCGKRHETPEGIVLPVCGKVHGTIYRVESWPGISHAPVTI
jgi:hypothetical protein